MINVDTCSRSQIIRQREKFCVWVISCIIHTDLSHHPFLTPVPCSSSHSSSNISCIPKNDQISMDVLKSTVSWADPLLSYSLCWKIIIQCVSSSQSILSEVRNRISQKGSCHPSSFNLSVSSLWFNLSVSLVSLLCRQLSSLEFIRQNDVHHVTSRDWVFYRSLQSPL